MVKEDISEDMTFKKKKKKTWSTRIHAEEDKRMEQRKTHSGTGPNRQWEKVQVDLEEHNEKGEWFKPLSCRRENTGLFSRFSDRPQKSFKLGSEEINDIHSDVM